MPNLQGFNLMFLTTTELFSQLLPLFSVQTVTLRKSLRAHVEESSVELPEPELLSCVVFIYLFIPGFSISCANLQKQLHEHDAFSFVYVTKIVHIYNSSAFFVLYSPCQQLSVAFCFVVCLNRH